MVNNKHSSEKLSSDEDVGQPIAFDLGKKTEKPFELVSKYKPKGDQPSAVRALVEGLNNNVQHQVLLGVTGSGKTFSIANVIAEVNRPALILAHNKTLAAQLYQEFKGFFPNNAVEYFVSYYDYYQPEAYVPKSDTYIEKDAQINEAIDRLRHSATQSLLTRNDVIIIASVSCIYGIGSKDSYMKMSAYIEVGQSPGRDPFLRTLVESQFQRNDIAFERGTFRVRGDTVEIFPAHEEESALRIEFFGDDVERITKIDPLRGKTLEELSFVRIMPASHYATTVERRHLAMKAIANELQVTLKAMKDEGRLLEAQRLEQRTTYDLELLETTGICKGIENYSRHLSARQPGEPPPTLLDYFPRDFIFVVDESHQSLPQAGGMYKGDQARKTTLVEHGFRLPSALDNRPLKFDELEGHIGQAIYVSATPKDYEIDKAEGVVVEQLIRPTGLLDPVVEVRPADNQVDDLVSEIQKVIQKGERVLVTTLTKRMAEDLSDYLLEIGVRAKYLHSDIDTIERVEILLALRKGVFDVLVGINLLREGLDLPEVSLVGILDADKEGFLRSDAGLIQTIGRAARNASGRAILYGNKITRSMDIAIRETKRRREIQEAYNLEHNITPKTIIKSIRELDPEIGYVESDFFAGTALGDKRQKKIKLTRETEDLVNTKGYKIAIATLRKKMHKAAENMDFELAASIRDEIFSLEKEEALG